MTSLGESRWNFPPSSEWPDDDVVALGGDLDPSSIIHAYMQGLFPMYVDKRHRTLGWWSPVQRGVLPLNNLRVTRSMRQSARKYSCTINRAFTEVMTLCSSVHSDGNWITDDFITAYTELHRMGYAHSVEVWDSSSTLVGGLYGLRVNRFFAGESMFHLATDASKVALMFLVESMKAADMTLLDTQWRTDHLESLGVVEVARSTYLRMLAGAISP